VSCNWALVNYTTLPRERKPGDKCGKHGAPGNRSRNCWIERLRNGADQGEHAN